MCKFFYNFLIRGKIGTIDFFDWLNAARKYDKVIKAEKIDDTFINEYPFFVELENGDTETNCIFYENLMIILYWDHEKDDKIVRVFAKRPEEPWMFESYKPTEGVITPVNLTAEIYVKYDVSVLKYNRCYGEEYRSGNWNKMFFKSICALSKEIEGFAEINKINDAYNDSRSKKQSH